MLYNNTGIMKSFQTISLIQKMYRINFPFTILGISPSLSPLAALYLVVLYTEITRPAPCNILSFSTNNIV